MPFTYFSFTSEVFSPLYLNLFYIPYLISLNSAYLFAFPFPQAQYLQIEYVQDYNVIDILDYNNIFLVLKRDYFVINESADIIIQNFSEKCKFISKLKNQRNPLCFDKNCENHYCHHQKVQPETHETETQEKNNEEKQKKTHKKQKGSASCPSFLEEFKGGIGCLALRRTQSQNFGRPSFFNANKSRSDMIGILNSITDRSDDTLKGKILNFINSGDDKCQEIVNSLLRRCLTCCNVVEIVNLNKVIIFLLEKSQDKFQKAFIERFQFFLEENKCDACFAGCNKTKNIIVFLKDLIANGIIKRKKVKEILNNLMSNIIDLMFDINNNSEQIIRKISFIIILTKCSYNRSLNEEILKKDSQEIFKELKNLFQSIYDLNDKQNEKTMEISINFGRIFQENFEINA